MKLCEGRSVSHVDETTKLALACQHDMPVGCDNRYFSEHMLDRAEAAAFRQMIG
jgi:hypothetical protein